ncbi:MAG: hypothetical protein DWQ07_16690 [Chloroflexi bacterium]|nr:MAG: hypothetical protein DWQ07_16690 [Chloroflexota bacterium]MBL1195390.1 hypothetical protein [Chloroflexota bacterium]NOH12673.1 hypothetical protein [Chloroflexota bacterium]
MHTLRQSKWFAPLLFMGVLLVGFGLMVPWLGYYWDDWPVIYLADTQGIGAYWDFYQFDRPFSAWTYILSVPILGTTPWYWHVFTLLLRWLAVLGMWWGLRGLWPERKREVTWMAVLFAVYPIFTQQSIAVAYSQHWITYGLFFLSLGAMIWAQRNPQRYRPLTVLAVLAAPFHMLTMEYFVGLELIRPAVLWLLLAHSQENWRQRANKVFRQWLPYLLVLLVFVIWRLFSLQIPDDPNAPRLAYDLAAQPIGTIVSLTENVLRDFIQILVATWNTTLQPALFDFGDRVGLLIWGLAVLSAAALAFLFWPRAEIESPTEERSWTRQAILFSLYAIFVSLMPVWFTGRQLIGGLYSDRFALPAMFGAAILLVSLLEWVTPRRIPKVLLFSILVGLALGLHLRMANSYRLDWQKQRAFYWQLAWRAPALEPGAPVVAEGALSTRASGYVVSTALNTLYSETGETDQPYWYFELFRGLHRRVDEFVAGTEVKDGLRTLSFSGNSQDSLFVDFQPEEGRCLWVLDSADTVNIELQETTRQLLRGSRPDSIVTFAESSIPENIFGPEPAHSWCYFYQKASLATQREDWESVLALEAEAHDLGFESNNGYERLPFIQAYQELGRWDEAQEMTLEAYDKYFRSQAMLCQVWSRFFVSSLYLPERDLAMQNMFDALACFEE